MALKISASDLLQKNYLEVSSEGVEFVETALTGGRRRFRFNQIDSVLMSADHKLSFQVGKEVFSIQTKPDDEKHQTVIASLVQEIRRTLGGEV